MKQVAALMAVACTTALPLAASAQSLEDKWQFNAILYGYFPDIGGSANFPAVGGSGSVNVSASTIITNLKFAFMGTLEGHKGALGFFTDVMYMDVSGSKSQTRDFSIRDHELPAGVTADFGLGLKGTVWTLAGTYRVSNDPSTSVDVLAGARLLDVKLDLSYSLSADVGPFSGPGRAGNSEINKSYWDAIIGAKGRVVFGANREWFVPYYVDVGTGESDLTWQIFGGLGYQFSWGSILGGWRYLDYKFKSDSQVQDLNFNGPMVGVAFSW